MLRVLIVTVRLDDGSEELIFNFESNATEGITELLKKLTNLANAKFGVPNAEIVKVEVTKVDNAGKYTVNDRGFFATDLIYQISN